MKSKPSIPERCRIFLNLWRQELHLTNLEKAKLAGEIKILDNQLGRFVSNTIRIAVFGRVGVGKSSLLNALIQQKVFATDVAHGCTRETKSISWNTSISSKVKINLIDTPGINEIGAKGRGRLARHLALKVDLILFILDSDITSIDLQSLKILLDQGKSICLVLNRCDQWTEEENAEILRSIRRKLPFQAKNFKIHSVAAAPREVHIVNAKKIRSHESKPRVKNLKDELINLLSSKGETLLAINSLKQADCFYQSLKSFRLTKSKKAAQGLIGRFATIKATGVAANPLLMIDVAGSMACDATMVIKLSQLYGLQLRGKSARKLLKSLSIYNSFIGGAQIGIQLVLGTLRQFLIFAAPITHGLSLASAGPVALIQALIAIQTTKRTGRLAAATLLRNNSSKGEQPGALLSKLSREPETKQLFDLLQGKKYLDPKEVQALLP